MIYKPKQEGMLANVEIPLYRIIINVYIHDDCEKAIKLSERMEDEFIHGFEEWDWKGMHGCYVFSENHGTHSIILAGDSGIDTISHECFHATMAVLKDKGIIYSEDSEECFAYVLGYLTQKVNDLFEEYHENK